MAAGQTERKLIRRGPGLVHVTDCTYYLLTDYSLHFPSCGGRGNVSSSVAMNNMVRNYGMIDDPELNLSEFVPHVLCVVDSLALGLDTITTTMLLQQRVMFILGHLVVT